MKSEKFFEIFTYLDDDLIENTLPKAHEPETVRPASRSFTWRTFVLSAAAVIAVFAAVFVGIKLIGSHRLNGNDTPLNGSEDETKNSAETSVQYGSIEVDWLVYSSAKEIVEHGDIIVSGRVTDISFAMLDKYTGTVVDTNLKDSEAELCTIYHVDVITPYKGCSEEKLQIRMVGGLKDYLVDEQIEVLKEHGGNAINILSDPPKIELGEEYLFVLAQFEGTLPCIINSMQTAFPLNDRTSKEKYSNASVNDIITHCCEVSVVHKGETLTLSPEQIEALYSLIFEAWSKVEVANDAIISEQFMKEYGEKGYCITSSSELSDLIVLIGEDKNDTVIGKNSYTGLPEGYREKILEVLNGNTLQQDPQKKVTVIHEGETLTLTPERSEALLETVEQAVLNSFDRETQLSTIISTQDMEEYGNNGYCITAEFNHYEKPQIKEGSDQKVKQICEATILISEEGESSYITYSYIEYSADSVSEKRSGGTFLLSKNSREKILDVLNGKTDDNTTSDTEPNTFFSTRSVMFEQAKEQVGFIDVKEISDPDFVGYELELIMPSGTVANITYLFKNGSVTVYDNSVSKFNFSPEYAEKFERDGKVFWKISKMDDYNHVVYEHDAETTYEAVMNLDVEEIIDVIITLI